MTASEDTGKDTGKDKDSPTQQAFTFEQRVFIRNVVSQILDDEYSGKMQVPHQRDLHAFSKPPIELARRIWGRLFDATADQVASGEKFAGSVSPAEPAEPVEPIEDADMRAIYHELGHIPPPKPLTVDDLKSRLASAGVDLDSRGRVNLGLDNADKMFLAHQEPDGTIVLQPARVATLKELER